MLKAEFEAGDVVCDMLNRQHIVLENRTTKLLVYNPVEELVFEKINEGFTYVPAAEYRPKTQTAAKIAVKIIESLRAKPNTKPFISIILWTAIILEGICLICCLVF